MDPISNQTKPLKILTIDGGGLQAVSTLLILNELLEKIAEQNGVPERKPRPCDVFDTIAGIGAGGWLAIFLGRFRMDITSCLNEWCKLTQRITPSSRKEKLRLRIFQHCYFDTDRLVEHIDHLTNVFGTGKTLHETDPGGVRTRYVFVAALKSDATDYNLFRTYEIPTLDKPRERLREGPDNPGDFKISSAFGVTGAARYFTPKWKEQMAASGEIRFRDSKFPEPHNITDLALDEMWGLYGKDVPLSIVVNIGPGLPNDLDFRQISRRFSWGSPTSQSPRLQQRTTLAKAMIKTSVKAVLPTKGAGNADNELKRNSVRFNPSIVKQDPDSHPVAEADPQPLSARTNTYGSIKGRGIDAKLKRLEDQIEEDIRQKLCNVNPGSEQLYYRLALDKAPEGTTQNGSSASGIALKATTEFLHKHHTRETVDKIAHRLSTDGIVELPLTNVVAAQA